MSRLAIFEHAGREVDVWYATYLKPSRPAANTEYPKVAFTAPTCCACGGEFRYKATHPTEVEFICDDCGMVATRRRA